MCVSMHLHLTSSLVAVSTGVSSMLSVSVESWEMEFRDGNAGAQVTGLEAGITDADMTVN